MDPCADGTHGCQQDFESVEDACVCRCRAGFTLRADGKTCKSESTNPLVLILEHLMREDQLCSSKPVTSAAPR